VSGPVLSNETKFFVSLRIFGFHLDFEKFSRVLGVASSQAHRAGGLGILRRPHVSDLWVLDTPLPNTETLDAHLKWLRRTLAPHYGFIMALKETAQVRSYCGFTADDRGSFRVSGEGLRFFSELDIDMELSLVFLGPPDSGVVSHEPEPTEPRAKAYEQGSGAYRTESELALRITAGSLDLGGISRALGFEPSEIHRAGDLDASGNPYPSDFWSLTVPLLKTDELDDHFKWLRMALLPHSDFLQSIKHNAEILVYCSFGTESDTGGVSISPEGLETCTVLDIPLEFDGFLL
jgi:Domain of unknown function (DUF4279)